MICVLFFWFHVDKTLYKAHYESLTYVLTSSNTVKVSKQIHRIMEQMEQSVAKKLRFADTDLGQELFCYRRVRLLA